MLEVVAVVGGGGVEHVEAVWACGQHCAMPDTGRTVVTGSDAPMQEETGLLSSEGLQQARHNCFTNIHITTSQRTNQHGRGSNRSYFLCSTYVTRHVD